MKKLMYTFFIIILLGCFISCDANRRNGLSEQIELIAPVSQEASNEQNDVEQNEIEQNKADDYDAMLIEQRVLQWTEAFCNKDGDTLYQLFDPSDKQEFFQMENVSSSKDDKIIDFDVIGLWPGENSYDYYVDGNKVEIIYYVMTSEGHAYTWIETLIFNKINGDYYIISEHLKKYITITNKDELNEAIYGYIQYFYNGMSIELNQSAINDKTGIYKYLFAPDTAVSYLLNLTGGNCVVKTEYEACTIVTYKFDNEDSIDFKMIQPYGADGIWLVDDVDVEGYEDNLQKIDEWYHKIDLEELKEINEVATYTEIGDSSNDNPLLLAMIPENDIYLYGYAAGDAVILRIKDNFQLFYWAYTSPRLISPEIAYGDYDKDGDNEIAISLHTGTGTGISVEQLYLVKLCKNKTMQAIEFTPYQYLSKIKERVVANYGEINRLLQFYIDGDKVGNPLDLTKLTENNNNYTNTVFGDQIAFNVSDNAIIMQIEPGCCFKDWAAPYHEDMPIFNAEVGYKDGRFSLINFELNEEITK